MKLTINQQVFFAFVRTGLWETDVQLSIYDSVDFSEIQKLAKEQSVVGLVAAGLDHVIDVKPPKEDVLQFVGQALQLEQQNQTMNYFIGVIVEKLRKTGIFALLVKGQGIAQCYEKPLWRSCGDVDFLLSSDNYEKSINFLRPLASLVEEEVEYQKHLSLTIDSWVVELHGTLRTGLSSKMDRVIDETQKDVFYGGNVRSWQNGKTQVFLPGVDNDVFFIFTHFLKHFYKGGLGLRQVCDWCRLLWTYKNSINIGLLEARLQKSGIMSEWKAFCAFAVEYLGMPVGALPLYSPDKKWKRKADRICSFILEVGNFGHNRDNSYYSKPFIVRKAISFGRRCGDVFRHARIFPFDSLRFLPSIVFNGVKAAIYSET